MRSVEELIKEVQEDVDKQYEYEAKNSIKGCILEIVRQQEIIASANKYIKDLQEGLKKITVKQVPANFLV